MPDGVPITAGIGTTIATELIGGQHYQVVKLAFGVLDSLTEVSSAFPLVATPGLQQTEDCTRAAISCASSGDNIIIAADTTHKIAIMGLALVVDSQVAVKLGEGGPTYWTGAMKFGGGGGLVLTEQGKPYFLNSAINKSFLINLGAAVQCSGVVWYRLI